MVVPSDADRSARLAALAARARSLPDVPGVYLMKDASDEVLYVGKAASLRDRVASYFVPSADLGPRKQGLLDRVADVETIECEGEWEALLAESRLIKDLQPRFNAALTDDRTYPYIAVTLRDDFPSVYITRTPAEERFRGARIFGPFTSPGAMREALRLLQQVFRFRTCDLRIREGDPANERFRPCLLHAIDQCSAPCANLVTRDDYRRDIDGFMRFLESKRSAMLRELRCEMEVASADRDYERASVVRDRITAIERLDDRERRGRAYSLGWQPEVTLFAADQRKALVSLQRTLGLETAIRCLEAFDVAHLDGGQTVASKVCFVDGRPFREGYRHYRIRTATNDDCAAIREVVSRRYREAVAGLELFPDVILVDGGIGQLGAALAAFEGARHRPPMVLGLAKREELLYVQDRPDPVRLGRRNPGLRLCQAIRDEAHRFARRYHHLLRRKDVLGDSSVG